MALVTDPVCGMQIESSQAPAQSQFEGHTYSFCSVECKETFERNPKDYVT